MRAGSTHRHHRPRRRILNALQTFVVSFGDTVRAVSSGRGIAAIAAGLVLALLAFGQAAAQNGIAIGMFRPLGPSFYAWQSDQSARDRAVAASAATIDGPGYVAAGRNLLRDQPLNAAAARTIAWGHAAERQGAKATAAMLVAERMSRRDVQAQSWLLLDVARRGDVAGSLRHFDALLRVEPALRPELFPRLVAVLAQPDARAALRPLLTDDTPWFERFLATAAAGSPSIAPIAEMLLDQPKLPDGAEYRSSYARLVQRLADEHEVALLARIYPRLPGADPATMASVSLAPRQLDAGYPPLTWLLSADADWGGSLAAEPAVDAKTALEGYAEPGTRGVVASKVVLLPDGQRHFAWRLVRRVADTGADGYWQLDCIDRGSPVPAVRSANLFGVDRPFGTLSFPAPCRAARIDLVIAGGTGGTSSNLAVGDLAIRASSQQR